MRLRAEPEVLPPELPSENRNSTVKATEGEEASRADVTAACGLPHSSKEKERCGQWPAPARGGPERIGSWEGN
ncbi:hypothetical protein PAL_GLEAN10014650 [Pteropus alecto]|uniref:Uncharacterized protein n=1 Tax=Pteropus alecto TaxID=9402 RepID=L5KNV5_PTEAL|nr:hypothetical protein PAL_GLEAN10014650 [Pteropus alecto]